MAARTDQLPALQFASKRLLGSASRLEVAAWIHRNGSRPINPTAFRRALEEVSMRPPSHSSLVTEIEHLREVEMLSVLGASGSEVWFETTKKAKKSVYFRFCQQLLVELDPSLARRAEEIESRSPPPT